MLFFEGRDRIAVVAESSAEDFDTMRPSRHSNHFILEAFDCDQQCPVAQTLLHVTDIEALRSVLGVAPDEDPELDRIYFLDEEGLAALAARFGVALDPSLLESADFFVGLYRRRLREAPYLIHTGYELPLLLDGRKKLARMSNHYPPMTFEGEDRFDHWVAEGLLHREEVIEPFESPVKGYLGHRTVYYTPKGEEWRIPAMKLIWEASGKSGGWNEHFERLEGMLFGYEDWQNDWWIDRWLQAGRFGGPTFCCPVTPAGLTWIEAAGFRALPPVEGPVLMIAEYDADRKVELDTLMLENPDHAAVVGFKVLGRYVLKIVEPERGPWRIQAERISELNRHLRGSIEIVARRDGPVSLESV
jgi:hypothetical protein